MIGMKMMHDEFCPNPDPELKDCQICILLKMARRDEQDKFSGDEEMDRESITEEAYARGFDAGKKEKPSKVDTTNTQISPDVVGNYIKDKMTTLNMQEVNALYDLYRFLGGK
jgi:hypothetical protein